MVNQDAHSHALSIKSVTCLLLVEFVSSKYNLNICTIYMNILWAIVKSILVDGNDMWVNAYQNNWLWWIEKEKHIVGKNNVDGTWEDICG